MAKRRMGIIGFLICLCLLLPCYAQAASTSDAVEWISTDRKCTLTLSYGYDGVSVSDLSVKLYKIADVSADFQYTLTAPFLPSGLILNGVQSNAEWNILRSTLESYILANRVAEDIAAATDQTGQICFEGLSPGLYLAVPGFVRTKHQRCLFDSSLISLPGLNEDGSWQYQVAVKAKPEILPPIEPDDVIEFKILKLWKGDGNGSHRPRSIEVEIFRDGKSHETVILSAENQWVYRWTAKDDGAVWKVAEKNVPAGYTVTMEKRGATFVLTNTLASEKPDGSKTDAPKTGDTFNILLYMVLLYVSGILLILLGITGKRKRV